MWKRQNSIFLIFCTGMAALFLSAAASTPVNQGIPNSRATLQEPALDDCRIQNTQVSPETLSLNPGVPAPKVINIFIGGARDSKKRSVYCYFQHLKTQNHRINDQNSKYFYWFPTREIENWIDQYPDATINMVGHSYGADTAATITSHLSGKKRHRTVNLLITLDPVSIWRPNYQKIQDNSAVWVNVMANARFTRPWEWIIFMGNRWRKDAQPYTDLFLEDPNAHHGNVTEMMQSTLHGESPEKMLLDRQ